ncbi:Ig-like domain-containing protein [Moraxella bovis]|uniref:Ig-like domain-containing protein n=1 Tax=Moraxella bovis TaxID=476 RepID=UPI002225CC88|nr:Ig-like domain-containing protein [Moraxella bovis]UYZ71605.1 Ig-like domain-containing protein [Moraxella bovis]UYZ72481.1 Ig-like domain-containing protein [Moraxella bovis]UZA14900.1 Ig-like domain-containing protein [Moraxella bovis]
MKTSKYQLIVIQDQTTETHALNSKKPLKLKAKKNTVYQIINEEGEVLHNPVMEVVGDDIYVYLPEDVNASLRLENFQDALPITDPTALSDLNANLATANTTAGGALHSSWLAGLFSTGLGATILHHNKSTNNQPIKNIDDNHFVPTPEPTIPLAITINAIDDGVINIADKALNFTLTGTANFDPTTTEQKVIVKIGGQDHLATLTGNTWTLDVSGETLAFAEGSQTLSAILTAKDHTGASVSTNATGGYNVDTQIDTPVITFDNLANDNIINLAESEQNLVVSGTVENAKDGDLVKVIIGGVSQDVPVQGGKFSLTVAGSTLKNHTQISATVITTDTAGNRATGDKNHSYEVDTVAPTPKITLNPITGDNRIDLTESAKPTTTITGNIGNFVKTDTNEFVLICLCSTCANNNQKTVEARLNDDGTFSAEIATDELTKYDSVSATIKSTDKASNQGEDSTSQTYTVEKPATPSITLHPIAGDNIVNVAEFNYGSANLNIAITGKIERAEVVTSTVKLEFYKAGVLAKTVDAELGADGVYTYRISGAELHRSYDTVKAILTTGGQSYDHSQSYRAAAFSPKWGNPALVPTAVSDDNVIDQNDTWQEFTTMTGTFNSIRNTLTAQGIENAVEITVTVNGKPYATTVTGQTGTFTLNVKTADLLADTDKVADVSAYLYDNAGNNAGGAIRATLGYTVNDKHISQPIVTVNPIDNINIAYQTANPSTTLIGSFELDGDVALANAPLTVEIGGQSFTAQKTVTSSGNGQKTIGTWTLDVPTQTLIDANGNLTAKLSATDHTGNQAQANTPATYKVDVNAPSVEVKLNAITDDNAITPDEINDTFTITGTVTGEFVASDKVTLSIGNETYSLDVVGGQFSQAVPKAVILANTAINATLTTQDELGNTGFDDDSLIYNVTAKDIKIELDPITTDNLINVSEQSTPIDVSGKVTGADAKAGQTVEIKVGEQTFTATVGTDLTFKTPIDGQLLAKHQNYTLSAQVLENGEFLASNTHNYDVANDVSASIKITAIGDNTNDNGVADGFGSVRLSGKLALNDSIFAQGYNSDSLEAIVVKIGDKSFNAGFNRDDMSFHIDLSKSEAEALQGQAISYEFITSGRLYYLAGTGDSKTVRQVGARDGVAQSELGKISVEWQDNTKAQDGVTTLSTPAKTTAITGVVAGSAQVGDDISVAIGGQNYTTKVQDGNAFVVNVDSETLAKHTGNITATLATKNLEGNDISVSDVAIYHNAGQATGEFVSKHTHTNPADRKMKHTDDDYNFAYMIDSVASNYRGGFLHTMHTPFGGFTDNGTPAKIKYYFATQEETTSADWQYAGRGSVGQGSTRDFSDNLKTFIRNSLTKFSDVANVEFEEVGSYQEVGNGGINFIYGDTIGGMASSGAFAFAGGNVVFDTANFSDTANPGKYHHYLALHELFHTFSGRHTDGVFTNYGFATPEDYTSEFSVMSYSPDYHWNLGFRDLSLYDVMYMHYRFGVAKTVNAGDDVYGFGNYASLVQDGTIYVADAGGVDTFDASYEQEGVTVNLTPGSWIYHTSQKSDTFVIKEKTTIEGNNAFFANQDLSGYTLSGNAGKHTHTEYVKGQGFIGYGTQIEHLKGSNFADILTGNNASNNIFGNEGDDKIDGGLGDDYLDGGQGADTLIGGQGDDSYVIDNAGDSITELAGEGTDTVYSYINYSLIDNLEHLTLLGVDNLTATGNSENNTLIGNSGNNTLIGGAGDDTLDGGRGSDTLTGGDGADYFRFSTLLDGSVDTITDFDVANDKIVLDDAIFTALAGQTTVGDFIKYNSTTGDLSYDADGAGVVNAIVFAKLGAGLNENQIQYQII